jgi:hypothetical protein
MAQQGKCSHHCEAYEKMTGHSAETSRSARQRGVRMQAIVYHSCGSSDDALEGQEIDKSAIKDRMVEL